MLNGHSCISCTPQYLWVNMYIVTNCTHKAFTDLWIYSVNMLRYPVCGLGLWRNFILLFTFHGHHACLMLSTKYLLTFEARLFHSTVSKSCYVLCLLPTIRCSVISWTISILSPIHVSFFSGMGQFIKCFQEEGHLLGMERGMAAMQHVFEKLKVSCHQILVNSSKFKWMQAKSICDCVNMNVRQMTTHDCLCFPVTSKY